MAVDVETNQYIYYFQATRADFRADPESISSQELAAAERHYAYLESATDRGQCCLPAARSITKARGGDLEAESPGSAQRFVEDDPFVAEE